MKNSWQILTLLLAVTVLVLVFKTTQTSNNVNETKEVTMNKEEVGLELIMTRSSVRSYTSQKVETDKIEKLLKAGMAAPTAGNKQPWEFVVISEREILDSIPPIIPGAHMAAKAQVAIAVCLTKP